MRNVVRNILSNWRNIFGKSINPLPYTFQISQLPLSMTLYTGDNVPASIRVRGIISGVESDFVFSGNLPNTHNNITTYYFDLNTMCTIEEIVDGDLRALQVYNVMVFDNR